MYQNVLNQGFNAERQSINTGKNVNDIKYVHQLIIQTQQQKEVDELSNAGYTNGLYKKEPGLSDNYPHVPETAISEGSVIIVALNAKEMQIIQNFITDCYQLIVTDDPEAFSTGIITIPEGCFYDFSGFDTFTLAESYNEFLKKHPAILCLNTENCGAGNEKQMAVYGYVKNIITMKSGSRILFKPIAIFPQSILWDKRTSIYFDIDVESEVELFNRNSWSIHKVNLFEAFDEAGMFDMPRPNGRTYDRT